MLLIAQMIGHLGLQRSLQDGLGQFLEQPVLPDDILGFLVVGQQLINQLLVDSHGTFILLFFPTAVYTVLFIPSASSSSLLNHSISSFVNRIPVQSVRCATLEC